MNNPKPAFKDLPPAEQQAYIEKVNRDHRANQLNPNNPKFHKARQK